MEYEQLIPWVKPVERDDKGRWNDASDKAFRVIAGDYVTVEDGTGIVHIAQTPGVNDAFLALQPLILLPFIINQEGQTPHMMDLAVKFFLLD